MSDFNVFQLVQIYLATDNERPINEASMFESNQWSMRQEKTTPSMVEYVCQSDTVLANIITKLVLARQQVQAAKKFNVNLNQNQSQNRLKYLLTITNTKLNPSTLR